MQRDHSGDSGERFWDCYVPRRSRFKSDASSSESRNSRIFCLSKLLSLVDPHRTRSSDWLTARKRCELNLIHTGFATPASVAFFMFSNKLQWNIWLQRFILDILPLSTYTAVAVKQREFLTRGKQRPLKQLYLYAAQSFSLTPCQDMQ